MQFSIKKIGPIGLESFNMFHIMVYILRIKDVHLLFSPRREEERNIIKKYTMEKLVSVVYS